MDILESRQVGTILDRNTRFPERVISSDYSEIGIQDFFCIRL